MTEVKGPRAKLYIEARESGMTYKEIAEKYGVSYQCVGDVCRKYGVNFKRHTAEDVPFPILRKWLNDNKVTRSDFARMMGMKPRNTTCDRISDWISGAHDPSKRVIDRMLAVTGLTYEEFFAREDNHG